MCDHDTIRMYITCYLTQRKFIVFRENYHFNCALIASKRVTLHTAFLLLCLLHIYLLGILSIYSIKLRMKHYFSVITHVSERFPDDTMVLIYETIIK
jgi:hypothetical protein